MNKTFDKLKKIKIDALYGKKKHFNAADRKERMHYCIGIPLILINILTGSILLYVITDWYTNWIKYVPLFLAFVSAILSALQTYLDLQKKVEGHRRIGNSYLAVMKKTDRLQWYFSDEIISNQDFIEKIEEISEEIALINNQAESYPTSDCDYYKAQKGIESGEENYTDNELNI